jgi:two-component system chemotaxis response regulator CheB
MIRVLVVDDSATSRDLLTEILGGDPEITVVGTARGGRESVRLVQKLRPDVITMDIHMPDMDGIEATKEIMITAPTPTVIVSASTLVHEVETCMRALRAGALTLLLKPPGPGSPTFDRAARELIETVKTMADVKVVRHSRWRPPAEPTPSVKREHPLATRFRAVTIAASTGGPPALSRLLGGLSDTFPAPILIVQHIPSGFVEGFAKWLDSTVPLRVKIAEPAERLLPGVVYVAPQERHLAVCSHGRVALPDDPPVDGFRPAATVLFRSAAEAFGRQVVAAILTGMGRDGVDGLRSVRDVGGVTVAQDAESSIVFGMPGAAVAENLVDEVLPIDRMASYLSNLLAGKSA